MSCIPQRARERASASCGILTAGNRGYLGYRLHEFRCNNQTIGSLDLDHFPRSYRGYTQNRRTLRFNREPAEQSGMRETGIDRGERASLLRFSAR